MSVHIHNDEARVHSIARGGRKNPLLVKPGSNYFDETDWKDAEAHAKHLVDAGTLKVKTGVKAPQTPVPESTETPSRTSPPQDTEPEAKEDGSTEGDEFTVDGKPASSTGKKKRW
jgi:hypothetical protein